MQRFALILVAVAVCALTRVERARADGVADEAEVDFRLGTERYQAGDYRTALAYFLASHRLVPNRNVRFNIARTFQRLGEYPEAYRWCAEALAGETDAKSRAQLEDALRGIAEQVAVLDVRTDPPGATVYVDRRDLGSVATTPARLAVREGAHRILVELAGYEPVASEIVQVARGSDTPFRFELVRIVGHVDVTASEGSEVRVDAQDAELACRAPCSLELAPGSHVLFFRNPHLRIAPERVEVRANERASVRAGGSPVTGSIVVTADESGALVEVDGRTRGFTPVVVPNVPVGVRHVRVSAPGFEPIEREVEVHEEREAELRSLSLSPSRKVNAAARVTQSIEEAPASVSMVSLQELEAFRYPTIYEALRGQRGVSLSYDGAYASITVRGLGQPGDYGNRVLVLSDGATLNDNILWQSYVGYDGRVDLGDLERIELVRGPGSVMYGTGAVTGVVNLVPRAMPDRASGEVRVSAYDARTARARAAGALPLPHGGGISLSAAGAHSDGERVALPGLDRSVPGVNRFDAGTLNGRLEYRALTVQAFFTTRDQDVPQGAYGALIGNPYNSLRDTRALLEARFEPELTRKIRLYTRAFANGYWFDAKQAFKGDVSPVSYNDERYEGLWAGAEARVVATVTRTLRLTLGADTQQTPHATLDGRARESNVTNVYLRESKPYQIYAAYGLAEWDVARGVKLDAGARVDAWSTFGATVNPRAALVMKPSARDVLKLVGGRAFRAPSIYELRYNDGGTTQVPSTYGGYHLKPELVWSGELEYTRTLADGWSALGAAHGQYAEDLIGQTHIRPGDASSPVQYQNVGSSVYTLGGDAELRREFRAGWMFSVQYGYLAARYAHAIGGSSRVPSVPNHYGSVRGIVPLGGAFKLAARAALEAPRRLSDQSRATTHTGVVTDVVLSGQAERFGLDYAVGVYNLFDFRPALPTDPTFVTRTFPQPGRSLMVSLGLKR